MRYTTLFFASIFSVIMGLSGQSVAATGLNKHDQSIATYNYDIPVMLKINSMAPTGKSLRDELDSKTETAPSATQNVTPVTPAVQAPTTQPVPKLAPKLPVVKTPKATDTLPAALPPTPPINPPKADIKPPTPTITAPTAPTTTTGGMMGGERVPLATTQGL